MDIIDPIAPHFNLTGTVTIATSQPEFVGNFSHVYRGSHNGQAVAVKVFKSFERPEAVTRRVLRERSVWATIDHPNILPFYGYADEPSFGIFGALISPWCANSDASNFLNQRGSELTIAQRFDLWKGAVAGIAYLHSHKPTIIHGNMHPSNVLINQHGSAMLTDFGLVQIFLEEGSSGLTTTTDYTGTTRYLSPELLAVDDAHPTTASDVYALGCLGLEFIFRTIPFSHRRNNFRGQVTSDIRQGVPPAEAPNDLAPKKLKYWSLIKSCWRWNPDQRPGAEMVLLAVNRIRASTGNAMEIDTLGPELTNVPEEEESEPERLPALKVPADLTGLIIVNIHARPRFKGNYSFVYQGTYQGELIAVKIIQEVGKPESMIKKVKRETSIWASASHPNIHSFYGIADDDDFKPYGALISPWCINGDLHHFLKEREDMPLEDRLKLWKGTIEGVVYLHSRNPKIVHGDLKPGNVLIDEHGTPKICDFGLARIFFDEEMSLMTTTQHTGTVRYLAPELLSDEGGNPFPTTASDVYALGCLGLEILYGKMPFNHRKNNIWDRLTTDIKSGASPSAKPPDVPASSLHAWPLLVELWKPNPKDRLPAKTVLSILETISSM
ncbi:hypothetical protein M408DRAFT_332495 [Serendipita vermifera MAFF 305830]|uniref:Protein kinase domain-containing protein n=1 Tax=Serendipita vermifera MAFF 305830 TaxID=933852 RepID=A0A0C2W9X0_SERVB|nr:hypothetical protein M408DRAFT_332495 [Serendipita vermifera MAFF 305830]